MKMAHILRTESGDQAMLSEALEQSRAWSFGGRDGRCDQRALSDCRTAAKTLLRRYAWRKPTKTRCLALSI